MEKFLENIIDFLDRKSKKYSFLFLITASCLLSFLMGFFDASGFTFFYIIVSAFFYVFSAILFYKLYKWTESNF